MAVLGWHDAQTRAPSQTGNQRDHEYESVEWLILPILQDQPLDFFLPPGWRRE